jgi:tetratricopeptide (TPR) repeat protein
MKPAQFIPAVAVLLVAAFFSTHASARENEIKEFETRIAKATFSVETGNYSEAISQYKQALAIKPGSKEATLGLGIACSRAGDSASAKSYLLKALHLDPADARTRYELGVVMYKLGSMQEARDFFSSVVERSPDEDLKTAARKYLTLTAQKKEGKRYALGLSLGMQYDTNVILEPDNPVTKTAERKSDLRAVLTADGIYRFYQSDSTAAEGGYSFYQSMHQRIHEFNVQQHTVKLAAARTLSGSIRTGLKYNYVFTLVGGKRFMETHEATPYFEFKFTPRSVTEFHFNYDSSSYKNNSLFPANSDQTGVDQTVGAAHSVRVGVNTTVSMSYDFDIKDANTRYWSYRGNKGSLGVRTVLGDYTGLLAFSYYDQQFRSIGPEPKRHDGTQEYTVGVSRPVGKDLSLSLNDTYTVRDSNTPVYEYTRNIFGVFLVTRL